MKLKEVKGIWDQLKALRAITNNTGAIHDAQVHQLKQWGPLALQHVEEIEIGVRMHDKPCVEFRAKGVTTEVPENFASLLAGLDRSIKYMLGDHFATRVLVDGVVIFEEKGKARKKPNLKKTIERLKKQDAAARNEGDPTDL
jgi:hypothetical protein